MKNKIAGRLYKSLKPYFRDVSQKAVKNAVDSAFDEYYKYMEEVRVLGKELIESARSEKKPIIVLAGRPYHIDPEINHGIDRLITGLGAAVISEDAIFSEDEIKNCVNSIKLDVLNQWTYHSRLYAAARYVTRQPDMQFIQLVSFGCGCDAVTTDECRRLLEKSGKIYTQIKIDEIENLGAAKIRVRSLFAAG